MHASGGGLSYINQILEIDYFFVQTTSPGCVLSCWIHQLQANTIASSTLTPVSRTPTPPLIISVHGARIVLSGKLEIDEPHWIDTEKKAKPVLTQLINERLPDDIRVFSLMKMNQGFRAREAAHWREYEYFLPLSLITQDSNKSDQSNQKTWNDLPKSSEEAIDILNQALNKMEGSKSFHNFHKLGKKDLEPGAGKWSSGSGKSGKAAKRGRDRDEDDSQSGGEGSIDEREETVGTSSTIAKAAQEAKKTPNYIPGSSSTPFYSPWVIRDRSMQEKTRSVIYHCRAEETTRTINGVEMICVRIKGQSFLLHQIRLMLGCAVLISRGLMPLSALESAFVLPYHINFPMAPAEGLLLVDAGFGRNCDGKTISLNPSEKNEVDAIFMNDEEYSESEQFKINSIYPRVVQDWSESDNSLRNDFIKYCERFQVPEDVSTKWIDMKHELEEQDREHESRKDLREINRIKHSIKDFQKRLMKLDDSDPNFLKFAINDEVDSKDVVTEAAAVAAAGDEKTNQKAKKEKKEKPCSHKLLLPNTIATFLTIHHQSVPGSTILTEALRGIATSLVMMEDDEVENLVSEQLIYSYVTDKGDLSYWSKQPRHKMIL